MIPTAAESVARLRDLAPKLRECQAEVDAAFARVAEFLDEARPGVTVHTADLAHPASPWSLAWARYEGKYRILICDRVDSFVEPHRWSDAEPEARLATLGQLPELLLRIGEAVAALGTLADRTAETAARVEAALTLVGSRGA
jgi:hypothetical protein